jgi:predicted nicotinamide N-methyase
MSGRTIRRDPDMSAAAGGSLSAMSGSGSNGPFTVSLGASLHAARLARLASRGGVRRELPKCARVSVLEMPGQHIGSISWSGGEVLGAWVCRCPEKVRGVCVVEVGCGLGVAGVAAALVGAADVVLTDREALLDAARSTITATLSAKGLSLRVRELEWGAGAWTRFAENLRAEGVLPRLILGADVVYTDEGARVLAATLDAALIPSGSVERAFISYKERGAGAAWSEALAQARIRSSTIVRDGEHEILELTRL